MEATDLTVWTLVPFWDVNHRIAQRNTLLPRRYCSCCFRDNAEAAQSRRDWFNNTDSSSSDSNGSSQLDPCEDDSFCEGPGTPCFFWSDRQARDYVEEEFLMWNSAWNAMRCGPCCDFHEDQGTDEDERQMMQRWCASHGITASLWSCDEFLEKTLPVSFLQLRRAGITIQYTRAKVYDSAFYCRWLRNLQVALSSWDGATIHCGDLQGTCSAGVESGPRRG